jgi:hypothetical protein
LKRFETTIFQTIGVLVCLRETAVIATAAVIDQDSAFSGTLTPFRPSSALPSGVGPAG